MGTLEEIYRRSLDSPEEFWREVAAAIDWRREPDGILDDSRPPFYRWFAGGELNTCHNALDRQVADGRGEQPALVYDSPVTATKRVYTYDLSRFRYLFLAGERLDPDTYHWASDLLNVPVIDHWWQTETGWPIAANCMGIEPLPIKPGSPTRPVPGYDVRILGEGGEPRTRGEEGAIVIRLPLPPGTLPTLWRDDARYVESYMTAFPGHYVTGDGGYFDEDGYLFVMGRIDDVINVAGHRISTGAIEQVVAGHQDVAECAVIGVPDEPRGQVPLGLVVLKAGADREPDALEGELVQMVRAEIGGFACFREARVVARLPKTRSGKILRGTIRKIAAGEEYRAPSTIDDPAILSEIETALQRTAAPQRR